MADPNFSKGISWANRVYDSSASGLGLSPAYLSTNTATAQGTVEGPVGPAGPAGTGIPTPVVNGYFVKGVGGSAIWQPITVADLNVKYCNGFVDGAPNSAGPWVLGVSFPFAFSSPPGVGLTLDASGLGYADPGWADYIYDSGYAMHAPRVVSLGAGSMTVRVDNMNGAYVLTGVRIRWVAVGS